MHFSRRTPASLAENEITRRLRARGRPAFDLTETNPTRVGLSPSDEEIAAALSTCGSSRYEPEPFGTREACEIVADRALPRGASIDPGRIILTASTSEAYTFLFKLLCDPGDFVLVPEPSYPLFPHLAALEAVRAIPYRLRPRAGERGWEIDAVSLEAGLAAGARAVVAVHPNNPTGSFLRHSEARMLDSLAAASGAAVISDEVFAGFAFARPADAAENLAGGAREALTFSLGGLSKSCGLPQMKLAWIVAGGPDELVSEAFDRLAIIADAYLSVATPVQRALGALLDCGERAADRIRERVSTNLEALGREFGPALEAPEGGWSAALRLPEGADDEAFVLGLLEGEDVLVHPGFFFDYPPPSRIVVSLLPEPDLFSEACGRMARAMGR